MAQFFNGKMPISMYRKVKDYLKKVILLKKGVYWFRFCFLSNIGNNSFYYFPYPWQIDLKDRLAKLNKTKKQGKINIVFIHEKPDPVVFRFRAYNVAQSLGKTKEFRGHYFFEYELKALLRETPNIDLLIFNRGIWSPEAIELCEKLKKQSKKIGYDTDDFVFDVDLAPELVKQMAVPREKYGFYFYYVASVYNLAKHADYFTCTNDYLKKKIVKFFKKPCYVVPNFSNQEQIAHAEEINSKKKKQYNPEKEFIIGYFSGTKTHDRDFQLIQDQIIKILEKYPQAKLMILGHLNLDEKFKKYRRRVIRHGLKNYLELEEFIARVDINLAPLVQNEFTNAKSEIKFFDAGMVGVPTIASPTFAFKKAIRNGKNGILAKDDEWFEKIELLMNDKNLYTKISKAAYKSSLQNHSGEKIDKLVESTYKKII